LECCSGGDLHRCIKHWHRLQREQGWLVPTIFTKHFVADMATALGYIHLGIKDIHKPDRTETNHHQILHRDKGSQNVFPRWTSQNHNGMPDIVLGDFGLACLGAASRGACGTPGYNPTECQAVYNLPSVQAVRRQVQALRLDMYCFGATLWSICTTAQFNNSTEQCDADRINRHVGSWPVARDPVLISLLTRCFDDEPSVRPNSRELV
ncbi:hypothetical protein K470DRAFT_207978, partial [Piedraia hortae CBS 480.64]